MEKYSSSVTAAQRSVEVITNINDKAQEAALSLDQKYLTIGNVFIFELQKNEQN